MISENNIKYEDIYPFFKLLPRRLDDRQLAACCADAEETQEGSFVISAGAGSGKTQVLAARFAWLVVTGKAKASEILTLTFTKKAAAEMYQRIYQTLKIIASGTEILTKEQKINAENGLKDFANTHIQTLDSYCAYILRQSANRFGITPEFTLSDNTEIYEICLRFVIENQEDKSIQEITDAGKILNTVGMFAKIIKQHTSIASEDDFFSSKIEIQKNKIIKIWHEKVQEFAILKEKAENAAECSEFIELKTCKNKTEQQLAALIEFTILNFPQPPIIDNTLSEKELAQIMSSYNESLIQFKNKIQTGIRNIKPDNYPVSSSFQEMQKKLLHETKSHKNESLSFFISLADFFTHYEETQKLYLLIDKLLQIVNKGKKSSGKLTFKDIADLAFQTLLKFKDIQQQEHNAFKRIMIDEFQDNNENNGMLLKMLNRPIFYVGDDKQSIYKFRGAEVNVFNDTKKECSLNKTYGVPSLNYNYRSSTELLNAFNQIFGGYKAVSETAIRTKMPKKQKFIKIPSGSLDTQTEPEYWIFPEKFSITDGKEDTFKALFTLETTAEQNPELEYNNKNNEKPVKVIMANQKSIKKGKSYDTDYISANKRLALKTAQIIEDLHKNGAKYSEIAILEKNRNARNDLTKILETNAIPYTLDCQSEIFSQAPINDIYNFIRLCVYPFDVNSFAAFLTSPFVGMTPSDLENILSIVLKDKEASYSREPQFICFLENDELDLQKQLSLLQLQKYIKAKQMYLNYRKKVLCQPLTQTISELWYNTGYFYETHIDRSSFVLAEQYDLLFELARQCDKENKTAGWFIDALSQKKFSPKDSQLDTDELNYPIENSDSVQIMTIHKSKGLQFKYVIISGCTGNVKNEKNREKYFFDKEFGLSVKFSSGKNIFFKIQEELSDRKNDAEFRRLFYVALTRAEEKAYILGSWDRPHSESTKSSPVEKIIEYYYPEYTDILTSEEECLKAKTNPDAPFDFEILFPIEYKEVYGNSKKISFSTKKTEKIKNFEKLFTNSQPQNTALILKNKINPSSLEEQNPLHEKIKAQDKFMQITEIIEATKNQDTKKYDFSYTDFGTIVHLYMEINANKQSVDNFEIPDKLISKLSIANREKIKNACIKMTENFNNTMQDKLGKNGENIYKTEYEFCMKFKHVFFNGTIDLILKRPDGGLTIIDYKTDKEIKNSTYYRQLNIYKKAAAEIFKITAEKINCILYYLRFEEHQIQDITEQVDAVTEEETLQAITEIMERKLTLP